MNCDVGEVSEWLENELCYDFSYELCLFSNLTITSPTSQLIRRPFRRFTYVTAHYPNFRCFTYVTAHSPSLPSLHLRHSSFSKPSVSLPTSQLILQTFRCFTYFTVHSPTLPSLYLRHSSFSNPSVALRTSQLILQPFRCFIYFTVHFPTLPSLYVRHSSFSNPYVASSTSQLILLPFRCFTYVTVHSPTLLSLLLCHRLFTYVTWPAAHDIHVNQRFICLEPESTFTVEISFVEFLVLGSTICA